MESILKFLTALDNNNEREWFEGHRSEYKESKQLFLHITEILINEVRSFDNSIGFPEPSKCVFRIFRDVRFSSDKRPFKNNYGAFISRGGRSAGNPGYYFHVQPGNSFVSGGIYMPWPDKLKSIRNAIFNNPAEFQEILNDPEFKNTFDMYADDKLKTAPRGYPKDFEHIELLRYKSIAPMAVISDEKLLSENILEHIVSHFSMLKPLNSFLISAIEG
jgi:uncharacterized protein (TIGR02453 family)